MTDDAKNESALIAELRGFIAEQRAFTSRLMLGYEAAHRSLVDQNQNVVLRAEKAENVAVRVLEMQVKVTEEREALASQRQQRELEAMAAKQTAAHKNAIFGDLRLLGNLYVKQQLGIPLSGNDSHGLQDLLRALSVDQVDTFMAEGRLQLTDGQRQMLMSTIMSLHAEEKAKAANAAPPTEPKPEAAE